MRNAVIAAVMFFGMTAAEAAPTTSDLPLLPMPASVRMGTGSFSLAHANIAESTGGEREAGERLRALTARSGRPKLAFATNGRIRFHRNARIGGAEGYRMVVTPGAIEISAATDAGLYYGAETLWQLIASSGSSGRIPAVTIDDEPVFSWRGLMLDSARHFQPVSYVEQLIDRMAMAKLNTLHWHLTDDQGWRIQIDRYPRLTKVGAWRREAGAAGIDPKTGKAILYGGYYSKHDIREIVAYARKRHVTVVPEIDMPGHATAMIAAYPALASVASPPQAPSHDWGILPNLLNPDDKTFTFIDNVLDEVMALFPSPFIHVGGDEAVKDQWRSNPAVQAWIRKLGLKDEDALQGWFTARVGDYLAKHGRRLVGWDEIQQGAIPANAAVMSWHGVDGAIAAAKGGHDAVLAASPVLYLDHIQSDSGDEPPGRAEIIDWHRVYDFDPTPAALTPDEQRHILGLQANLWTEHVRTTDYADRMIWPRAAIVAEIAWSNPRKDWPAFSRRLLVAMARWRKLRLGYDPVPLEPEALFGRNGQTIAAGLRQQADVGTLRYSTNDRPPSPRSPAFEGRLTLQPGSILSAQAFARQTPLGTPKRWPIGPALLRTRSASEMELCSNSIALRIEDDGPTDGVRRVHWVDIMNPCWIWRGAPLEGITRVRAEVGRLPFNFAIGDDIRKIRFEAPVTPAGELHVHGDSCDGPIIAAVPLQTAATTSGVAEVTGQIAGMSGTHDLCIKFAQSGPDPFWVLDRLTLQ